MDTQDSPEGIGQALVSTLDPEAPTAVDAAYTDASVRTLAIRGTVHRFPAGTRMDIEWSPRDIVVCNAEGLRLGYARLSIGTGLREYTVIAEAELRYDCPERLSLEAGTKFYLYPKMGVKIDYDLRFPSPEERVAAIDDCLLQSGGDLCHGYCLRPVVTTMTQRLRAESLFLLEARTPASEAYAVEVAAEVRS